MSYLTVNGGKKLRGEISIHGAKNSVLPLLAATFLCRGQSILHNCPWLSDVKVSLDILSHLGCSCRREGNTVIIDSPNSGGCDIPEYLMREMRSSIVFMGAVAAKTGHAVMSLPGGCELGPRPIDIHIDALKRLGATVEYDAGRLVCDIPDGVKGTELHLKFPSVGATENIILASATGRGTTVIRNAAREPEIVDLASFLNLSGADIKGAGTDAVVINGVSSLKGTEYTVMPDRIIAATCMFAVAACGGKITVNNAVTEHLVPIICCLRDSGCDIEAVQKRLTVSMYSRPVNFDTVTTQPYPGFPTDAGPLLVAMSAVSKGTGVFIENIFDNRFRYVDEMKRFGADIKTVGRVAVITGVKALCGAEVRSYDLRGGAALTVAAMSACGRSIINNPEYIDRGYEKIENIFGNFGADIKRIQE